MASPSYDIGRRIKKYFPNYKRYFIGYVVGTSEPAGEKDTDRIQEDELLYTIYYPEDTDEETMTEAQVRRWDDGTLGDDGKDDLGKDEVDESDLLGSLLQAFYSRHVDDIIGGGEDDAKPPARKRNRISGEEKVSSAADAKYAAELAAAEVGENCEYVEGGRTFEARVVDHRIVQSGGEESKPVLKFLVEWRRKVDVAAATAVVAAGAGPLADSDSDSTSSSSAAAAMEIESPIAVVPNTPPLSSSWMPLKEFIAPSAALAYLNNNTSLPAWEKEGLVKDVIAFKNALERDNIFKTSSDEPSSCGEIDFCCYLCQCGGHSSKLAKCQNVSKYHRGCCHGLDNNDKLESFLSPLGRVQERFLKQTTAADGGASDDDCTDKSVPDNFTTCKLTSSQSRAVSKRLEEDRKMQRHLTNVLDSRKRSAIARESRSDNDLALAAPESQRWTDETAVAVHKRFQQLCKARRENPTSNLKREAVVLEVFAGIGGATVALKKLGVALKTVVVVEHDRAAVAVHRANHDPSYGSGSAVDDGVSYIYSLYETYEELEANLKAIVREIGPVDIIVGGPPCQDHSKVNARRKGADGVHGRYMRDFPNMISLVDEYNKELHGFQDLLFLVENVPGSQDATANYGVSEFRCDAAFFGPCHRDRIFYFNWEPDAYPDVEHPAMGTTCLVDGWVMPTMFRKGLDAKAMTLLASKTRTKDVTLFKIRAKDDAPINPGEDRPVSHVEDCQYFDTNDRERLMGLPDGYVETPIIDLYKNLKRAMTVGVEKKEWRDVVPPMYWSFLGLGPGGYTFSIDDSIDDKNDSERIALGLKEKNQKSKVCMKDFEYAWHLIGNGFSIPQVVFLLRPLQQLFHHRDYAGYTDEKYAWEKEDLEDGSGANPPPAGGVDGRANADGTGAGAGEEDNETGHHQQDTYVDSSDDDNSL